MTFIDTTHEYIVDKNGNISLKSTDIKNKVEQINFDAGCDLTELGFEYVNPYSTERNAALKAIKTVNGMRVFASWSNGYAYLQSIEKYDFSNIVKIEVGTDYSADTTSGLLTFSVGLASDETTNTGFENDYKTTIQKTNQKKTYSTMVEAQDVVELDTSKITGSYYLKFLSQHSSSPSAYTMGAKIFWVKIYSNK